MWVSSTQHKNLVSNLLPLAKISLAAHDRGCWNQQCSSSYRHPVKQVLDMLHFACDFRSSGCKSWFRDFEFGNASCCFRVSYQHTEHTELVRHAISTCRSQSTAPTRASNAQQQYSLIDLVGRVDDGKTLYEGPSFMLAVITFRNTSFGLKLWSIRDLIDQICKQNRWES